MAILQQKSVKPSLCHIILLLADTVIQFSLLYKTEKQQINLMEIPLGMEDSLAKNLDELLFFSEALLLFQVPL